MNEISVRRVAATLTIGSFSVAALMGIAALLGGGAFDEGEGRILLTTLVVGCASICMLCYLATTGTRWGAVGVVGAVALVLPVTTALMLVWSDGDGVPEELLKAFGSGVVVAVTLAQVCLLLGVAGARRGLWLVLGGTIVLAGALGFLVSSLILGALEGDDIWRPLGVVAILDVLGTLVTIAMAKFGGRDEAPASPGRGHMQVVLTGDLALALQERARVTGRPPSELVTEAVEQFLRA